MAMKQKFFSRSVEIYENKLNIIYILNINIYIYIIYVYYILLYECNNVYHVWHMGVRLLQKYKINVNCIISR